MARHFFLCASSLRKSNYNNRTCVSFMFLPFYNVHALVTFFVYQIFLASSGAYLSIYLSICLVFLVNTILDGNVRKHNIFQQKKRVTFSKITWASLKPWPWNSKLTFMQECNIYIHISPSLINGYKGNVWTNKIRIIHKTDTVLKNVKSISSSIDACI